MMLCYQLQSEIMQNINLVLPDLYNTCFTFLNGLLYLISELSITMHLTLYVLNYFSKVIESNNFHPSNRHDFWPVSKRPQQRMLQNYTRRKQNMYPTCHDRF